MVGQLLERLSGLRSTAVGLHATEMSFQKNKKYADTIDAIPRPATFPDFGFNALLTISILHVAPSGASVQAVCEHRCTVSECQPAPGVVPALLVYYPVYYEAHCS